MKEVIVTVSPLGEVTIEASGFKGNACEKATKALEEAMGLPGKRSKKPEHDLREVSTQKVG